MKSVTMFGAEHCNLATENSTYEIFTTFEQAQNFCNNPKNWNENTFPLCIFKADFNVDRVYQEDGMWNYDDFSDTILKYHDFKLEINAKPIFA